VALRGSHKQAGVGAVTLGMYHRRTALWDDRHPLAWSHPHSMQHVRHNKNAIICRSRQKSRRRCLWHTRPGTVRRRLRCSVAYQTSRISKRYGQLRKQNELGSGKKSNTFHKGRNTTTNGCSPHTLLCPHLATYALTPANVCSCTKRPAARYVNMQLNPIVGLITQQGQYL